jgi:hypothetical protein
MQRVSANNAVAVRRNDDRRFTARICATKGEGFRAACSKTRQTQNALDQVSIKRSSGAGVSIDGNDAYK